MKLWIPFALLASIFAALVAVFSKKCFACPAIDFVLVTALTTLISAAFIVIVALFMGKGKLLSAIDTKTYVFIVLTGIAACLSSLCYFFALNDAPTQHVPAADAFSRMGALFVLLIGVIGFQEQITIQTILGGLFLILGAGFLSIR